MNANKRYENFIVFLAPLINSLGGIAIDLYAPSIPSMGRELGAGPSLMQNTITITLLFYAIGQLFFGIMADARGRRPAVLLGLSVFLAGSLLATAATSIDMLLLARALQGFAIGACQVVARALLVDVVKGPRFYVAIIYLSLAFGLGPVVAPYVGGVIEVHLGWRYNFVLYAAYAVIVLAFVLAGLKESLAPVARRSVLQIVGGYRFILVDSRFCTSVIILGSSFSAFLLWNVFGPHIVQERLGHSAQYFGTTALGVGSCYLAGTLFNRVLIRVVFPETLMWTGLGLFLLGIISIAAVPDALSLTNILGGIMLIAFGQGFIFSNAMARSMSLFPDRAGVAASLQGCLMLVFGALTSGVVSTLPLESNLAIAGVFFVLLLVSLSGMLAARARWQVSMA
ncbi:MULTISPECIES: multidrug effflux MFS transporter [Pseudomonas]|uniref:multidrug effflux MFS transporter n=1 Tax=Pseudomonas TaxID=286 RepID=UPI0002A1FD9F|nr:MULTISPECIES: multidrug effflux MFS transporter [Pseudomonas]MBB1608829.1 MFS transporter [Pseudomonas sp. UMC76]MBB1637650.1 MFS transporter [Pseudomonas sp. UME83]NTX91845.1 multidrug effflux MFS transporter [Pseudomonas sp. UMA643]NTY20810.1 multidrug effflux MFS transporter [Pseudomonas sp. UMC3103]NTY25793.1 multidrug effflux MFS transporter [Pseudomonas sp. UMA603]